MQYIFYIFLSLWVCSSCTSVDKAKIKPTINIMPLGDSITYEDALIYKPYGNIDMPNGKRKSYRAQLAYMLKDAGVHFHFVGSQRAGWDAKPKFDPDNEGHPGWTSWEIANKIYAYLKQNPPNIILLHIGTNDWDSSVSGLNKILDEIDRFEKDTEKEITVYVALIINVRDPEEIFEEYNKNLAKLIHNRIDKGDKLKLVDMRHILQHGDYLESIHPNAKGYKKMAKSWFEALINTL